MPISLGTSSLLDFSNTRSKEVLSFLEEASHPLVPATASPKKAKKEGSTLLPSNASNPSNPSSPSNASNPFPSVLLLFLESSTRTRCSFELACHRVGALPLWVNAVDKGSSADKGESPEDMLRNLMAMKPDVLVLRANDTFPMDSLALELAREQDCPLINAGWGCLSHPTQNLGDAYSLLKARGKKDLEGEKLVLVGDLVHSRVARSCCQLFPLLGAELGFCAPGEWLPPESSFKVFSSLKEALAWGTSFLFLRQQKERHSGSPGQSLDLSHREKWKSYRENFALKSSDLKELGESQLILHPGPVEFGVELDREILKDKRSLIFKQVEGGLKVRSFLLQKLLENKTVTL